MAQKKVLIGNPIRFSVEVAQEALDEVNRLFELGQRSERQVKAAQRTLIKAQEDLELSDLNTGTDIRKLENSIKVINRRLEKIAGQDSCPNSGREHLDLHNRFFRGSSEAF